MIFVFLFFILLVMFTYLYKTLYFSSVAVVKISSDGASVVTLKPNKKMLRDLSGNYAASFVKVAPGIVAFIVDRTDTDPFLMYKDFRIRSDVYLFRVSKGRFKSIDLTDRLLVESISKFNSI